MKTNIKSVVVLTSICVVVAALLSITNYYTQPVIEKNKAAAANDSLIEVMADAEGFEELELPSGSPETVTNLFKETSGKGFVVILSTKSQYSSDNMGITVGIGTDGKICGVKLTGYYESKDFGQDTYPQTYVGADSALAGIDTVAGVTFSSTAFKNAVSDAFSVLVASGAVSEGEKSDEQLISELIPVILPGCADSLGAAHVTEIDANGYTKAYAADNSCGYVVVASGDKGTYLCAINAFGDAKCYDLDGNEIEANAAEIAAKFPVIANDRKDKNLNQAAKACSEGAVLTPIESVPAYGVVNGAFTAQVDGATYYVFNMLTFGYSNELMEMAVVLDDAGKIVNYRTVGELILHEEYYGAHQLKDKKAYKEQFNGVDESSFNDEMPMVAGATCTANAVKDSIHGAFDAFKAVKEAK